MNKNLDIYKGTIYINRRILYKELKLNNRDVEFVCKRLGFEHMSKTSVVCYYRASK